ncbi:MAG: exonuclease domain-containing protein [Candidatus Bipolaricaulia bacterium]
MERITFVAFDVETTGLFPVNDRLVELAGVKFRTGQILDTFDELIDPKIPIPADVSRLHGITNEMVAGRPNAEAVVSRFLRFIAPHSEEVCLLAHNAGFDVNFVGFEISRMKRSYPPHPILDTLELARNQLYLNSYKLEMVAQALQVRHPNAHRALADSLMVKGIFEGLTQRISNLQQLARQTRVLTFADCEAQVVEPPRGYESLAEAIETGHSITMIYLGGSQGTHPRRVTPHNLVRMQETIYLSGHCHIDGVEKAFQLDRIRHFEVEPG